MRRALLGTTHISGRPLLIFLIVSALLGGCAVAPTIPHEKPAMVKVKIPAEKAKSILEEVQKSHPDYTIRALLKPQGSETEVHLTVYTLQDVHMVVNGFQEPEKGKKVYPDCNHWFDLTRSFDPACGGGPYIGTANLLAGDGMALGLMFDLYQAARYPFTFTHSKMPDKNATTSVINALQSAEKSADSGTPALLAKSIQPD